jgi:hypothetical protein
MRIEPERMRVESSQMRVEPTRSTVTIRAIGTHTDCRHMPAPKKINM